MFEIVSGLQIPEDGKERVRYPFQKMSVGDSFWFPLDMKSKVISASNGYAKRHGVEFKIATDDYGCRIWRVA